MVAGNGPGDELWRRPTAFRRRERELEEEGESEDAQKTCKLTLDVLVLAVVKEEVEAGGNHSAERRPEAEKNRTAASIAASPRRFLGRGGRGRSGGAFAPLRFCSGWTLAAATREGRRRVDVGHCGRLGFREQRKTRGTSE